MFLNKKLNFSDINFIMEKLTSQKKFLKYKNIIPKKLSEILNLNNYIRSNLEPLIYKR